VLPEADTARLDRLVRDGKADSYEIRQEGGLICVVLHGFQLPPGLALEKVDLLLRLPPGFPDAPPDMFWADPPILRANGSTLPASDLMETYLGKPWQRFSRHLGPDQWRPGTDSLNSFIAIIRKTLKTEAEAE
jgi:hypothetical protein